MASVFAPYLGYGVVLPVLPSFLARLLGGNAAEAVARHTGLLAAVFMFALFVGAPLWGRLSDRIGRRPVILLGLGGCAVALGAFGLVGSLWAAYVTRALGGAFVGALLPVCLAYVSDTSAPQRRARRYALITAASTLGLLVGPALGGWFAGAQTAPPGMAILPGSAGTTFLAAAVAGAAIWLAVYFGLPESPSAQPRAAAGTAPRAGSVNVLALLALLGMFGLGSFEVAITLRGQQVLALDPFRIGLLFVVCSLVMIATQVAAFAPLVTRFGFRPLIVPAFLLMAGGLVWLTRSFEFIGTLWLVGLVAAGSAVLIPMLAYRASLDAGGEQGAALGRQTAAGSLGQSLGSAAGGWLFGIAADAPFWVTALLLVVGAAISLVPLPRARVAAVSDRSHETEVRWVE